MKFNITEDLAALMPMKRTATGEDLYEQVNKVMQNLNVPIEILAGMVKNAVPSTVRRNSGVSSLITNDVKNTKNRNLIICHCLIH